MSFIEGVRYSSLALLAVVAALGPGPPIRRLPVVALLALAWFCAAAFGDRLAGGEVNHNHTISDAILAIVVFPLAALALALLNYRSRWRLVRGPDQSCGEYTGNRFSLPQLWAGVTAAVVSCVVLRLALSPYDWQLGGGDDTFDWTEWLANRLAEEGHWQVSACGATLAAMPWALPVLGRIRFQRTLPLILAGGFLLASLQYLFVQFWTHISVWPATSSVLRIHYVSGAGNYIGVAAGVVFSAFYWRSAGWRLAESPVDSPRNVGPVDSVDHGRRRKQRWCAVSLAALLVLMAVFAACSVGRWRAAYVQQRLQKIQWQEEFDQQRPPRAKQAVPLIQKSPRAGHRRTSLFKRAAGGNLAPGSLVSSPRIPQLFLAIFVAKHLAQPTKHVIHQRMGAPQPGQSRRPRRLESGVFKLTGKLFQRHAVLQRDAGQHGDRIDQSSHRAAVFVDLDKDFAWPTVRVEADREISF